MKVLFLLATFLMIGYIGFMFFYASKVSNILNGQHGFVRIFHDFLLYHKGKIPDHISKHKAAADAFVKMDTILDVFSNLFKLVVFFGFMIKSF
jgi:hypothetical protein